MLLSAISIAQTKQISLDVKEQSFSDVINQIEQQSSYRVIYNSSKIDATKEVTISVNNKSLESTLKKLLEGSGVSYVLKNNQILLVESKPSSSNTNSQQSERLIKGIVLSASDNFPLPGATILIKETSKGVVTNMDGEFTYLLKGNDINNMILKVSYLGHKTIEIPVGEKTNFEILKQNTSTHTNITYLNLALGRNVS